MAAQVDMGVGVYVDGAGCGWLLAKRCAAASPVFLTVHGRNSRDKCTRNEVCVCVHEDHGLNGLINSFSALRDVVSTTNTTQSYAQVTTTRNGQNLTFDWLSDVCPTNSRHN